MSLDEMQTKGSLRTGLPILMCHHDDDMSMYGNFYALDLLFKYCPLQKAG